MPARKKGGKGRKQKLSGGSMGAMAGEVAKAVVPVLITKMMFGSGMSKGSNTGMRGNGIGVAPFQGGTAAPFTGGNAHAYVPPDQQGSGIRKRGARKQKGKGLLSALLHLVT